MLLNIKFSSIYFIVSYFNFSSYSNILFIKKIYLLSHLPQIST